LWGGFGGVGGGLGVFWGGLRWERLWIDENGWKWVGTAANSWK
jgi:hypothetical protein